MKRGMQHEPSSRPKKSQVVGSRSSNRKSKAPTHADGTTGKGFASMSKTISKPALIIRRSSGRSGRSSLNPDGTPKKNYSLPTIEEEEEEEDGGGHVANAQAEKKDRERQAKKLEKKRKKEEEVEQEEKDEKERKKEEKAKQDEKDEKERKKKEEVDEEKAKQDEKERNKEEKAKQDEKERKKEEEVEQEEKDEKERKKEEKAKQDEKDEKERKKKEEVDEEKAKQDEKERNKEEKAKQDEKDEKERKKEEMKQNKKVLQRKDEREKVNAAKKKSVQKKFDRLYVGSEIQTFTSEEDYTGKRGVIKAFDDISPYLLLVKYDDDDDDDGVEVDLMLVFDFDHVEGKKKEDDDKEYADSDSDDSEDEKSSTGTATSKVTMSATTNNKTTEDFLKGLQDQLTSIQHQIGHTKPKGKTSSDNKRSNSTRAQTVEQMKDEVVRRAHDCSVKFVEQVQFCSNFKKQEDRDHHPMSLTMMVNIDGLIPDPNKPGPDGRKDRAKPVVNFFAQEGVSVPVLAKILKKAAKNMLAGKKEGWTIESDSEKFHEHNFGQRMNRVPSKNHKFVAAMAEEKEELLKEEEELSVKRLTDGTAAALSNPNQNQNLHDRRTV
jgi:hypothetical protein